MMGAMGAPMMRPAAAVACAVLLAGMAGCARRTLDVGYPDAASNKALLASVASRRVVVTAVGDRRADTSRIGSRPDDGKPIVTARPVGDIVRDALLTELGKNGHEIVTGRGDAIIAADVEDFSLDAVGSSASTRYVGRVAIAVVIADGRSGDRLLVRRYVGIRRRTAEADSKDAWREVMDTALIRTIHDLATDPDLVSALGRTAL